MPPKINCCGTTVVFATWIFGAAALVARNSSKAVSRKAPPSAAGLSFFERTGNDEPEKLTAPRMLVLIYMLTIWSVAGILLLVVNRFEPNPLLAFVLRLLVLTVATAAITNRLMR